MAFDADRSPKAKRGGSLRAGDGAGSHALEFGLWRAMVPRMSVEEIKKGIESLSEAELGEVAAFLFRVRHLSDADYEKSVTKRLGDKDDSHWLSPDEFEKRLTARA
jgi:rRNA maturation endonuclease Nob1